MRKTENIINRTGINKTECKKTGHSKENKIPGVWNGSLFFLIIILGITLGIFAGCKNIFVPEPPATPEAAGPGGGITVPLRLFTGSARSVMPRMEDLNWEITATSDDAKATVLGKYPDFKIYFPFKGKWTIKVKGKSSTESDAKEIFTGEKTMEITGSTVSISILLSPEIGMGGNGAKGKLKLTIKSENVCGMLLTYRIDSGDDWGSYPIFDGEKPDEYSISEELSVGQHTLDLYFGEGSKFYFCTVAVNIWPGMTSDQWIKTSGEEYITDDGEFVITKEMVDKFVKTMGSVVFVDENVDANTPGTGSIYAPVNSVSKAVDILRKANPDRKCNGTIMVSGATTIGKEIEVKNGETLTVKGTRENASITNTSGRVFNITGGSLTLEENITLTGTNDTGNGGAVYVNGGTFTMKAGSKITRSSASYGYGGGVYVDSNGIFTMGGGTISKNSASSIDESGASGAGASGGGVCISEGTFTMSGDAVISGNTASSSSSSSGGGVYIHKGTFTMSGGAVISGNSASSSSSSSGGGVYVSTDGIFTMEGGTIGGIDGASANSAKSGGGVCVYKGVFTMSDGSISRNTATDSGGGVFVQDGTFTMKSTAIIQENEATGGSSHACGGGVYVNGGEFTMTGTAIIQDNEATGSSGYACGGGVYVNVGEFTMNGDAIIQGNEAAGIIDYAGGGGVYVNGGGEFTMNDSAIIQKNNASTDETSKAVAGGGVYLTGGGTFSMVGNAKIQENKVTGSNGYAGGGVVVYGNCTFTMSGGIISGNSANNGGGVYVDSNGEFTMSGGTIKGNTATQNGGGMYAAGGTFTVSGSSPVITSNTANNVYLANGNTITIGDGELNTSARIGVTTATSPAAGTEVQITDTAVDGAVSIFIPDAEGCIIMSKEDAVYLADSSSFEVSWDTGSGMQYGSFADAISALNTPDSGGTIILQQDIDDTNEVFGTYNNQPITFSGGMESNPVILDLNGHTIDRALETAQEDGTVISVSGALMLKDSTGSGKITGGNNSNNTTFGTWGGGVCVQNGAFFTMKGGNISYNFSEIGGGGVYVCNGGSFTMTGGTIGGSDVNDANKDKSGGGGVFVNGEFTMSSGTITGNTTGANGGGVAVTADGTFTMSGTAVISANKASNGSGGGVYVFGNFTMTGGTIGGVEPNTAVLGGGVYVGTDNFTLGPSSTGSSPVISGNEETDTSPNNVYLDTGKTLSITGELKKAGGSCNIGISMATPGVFTAGWSSSGSTDSTFFFSDDTERNVALSGSELSLNLVRVKGGSCTLNDKEVTLSSFWISPCEVTQEEYFEVMSGYDDGERFISTPSRFPGDYNPVESVSWYDAIVFCNFLSMKENLTPCYTIKNSTNPIDWGIPPDSKEAEDYNAWAMVTCDFNANGYRLPTETEWEYAARGGQTGITDGSWNYDYSGSNTLDDVAWYGNNSDEKTHEVGKKQSNALGLYDMSGNVWEWCWDWFGSGYPSGTEDPAGPDTGSSRVIRGGSWMYISNYSKVSYRFSQPPTTDFNNCGFRVVRSAR